MICPDCKQLADHRRPGVEHRAVCRIGCTCQHHDPIHTDAQYVASLNNLTRQMNDVLAAASITSRPASPYTTIT